MQQALLALEPISMLVILALVGLLARKIGLLEDPTIKAVAKIVLNIAQPALMIHTTQVSHTPDTVAGFLTVVISTCVILVVAQIGIFMFLKKTGHALRPLIATLSVMPNVGYIGIPLVSAIFGQEMLLYLAAYITGFSLAQWTIGLAMFAGFSIKSLKNLLNPIFLSAALGATLFLLNIHLPAAVGGALSQLSTLNTPLCMMLLGARLSNLRMSDFTDWRMWLVVVVKLAVMPLVLLLGMRVLGISGFVCTALVMASAMPSGSNAQMLAERYDCDVAFAAKTISVSTICCIVSIPLIIFAMSI